MVTIQILVACTSDETPGASSPTTPTPTPTTTTTTDTGTKGTPPPEVEIPAELEPLEVTVAGTSSVEAMLLRAACPESKFLVMLGADGAVRWVLDLGQREITAYELTGDDAVVVVLDGTEVRVVELDGTTRWSASGFDRPLHHDVYARDGRAWVLNADAQDGYVLDGFYVLEDGATVGEWDLADHVTPTGGGNHGGFWNQQFPGADDWSHANTIWVGDDQVALVSLRHQDAVLAVDADPDSAGFGDIVWTVTGTASSAFDSDYAWTGGGFDDQHHATLGEDGRLRVFDNRAPSLVSRGLVVDLEAGTATEVADFPLDVNCPVEGGHYGLPGGGALVSCATEATVTEFDADGNDVFTLTATCGSTTAGPVAFPRAIPVD